MSKCISWQYLIGHGICVLLLIISFSILLNVFLWNKFVERRYAVSLMTLILCLSSWNSLLWILFSFWYLILHLLRSKMWLNVNSCKYWLIIKSVLFCCSSYFVGFLFFKNVMEGKKVVNMITFHVLEFFEIISLGILFYSYILIEIQSGTGLQCSYYTQLDDFWLIMTPVILLSSHFLFSWIVLWKWKNWWLVLHFKCLNCWELEISFVMSVFNFLHSYTVVLLDTYGFWLSGAFVI